MANCKEEQTKTEEDQTSSKDEEKRTGCPKPSSFLSKRQSILNMTAAMRGMRNKDRLEGMGYIYAESCDWTQRFPEAKGSNQSPIDINSRTAVFDKTLSDNPLHFNYLSCRDTDVCNNGHALVVSPRHNRDVDEVFGSETPALSTLSGASLPLDNTFELVDLRFHWGREDNRGSEHTVNFKAFPMELQLIHYNNSRYGSLEEAFGRTHGIAIVAIFVQVGREHHGLKLILEHFDEVRHKGRQKTISSPINPSIFLPDPLLRDFWVYDGSLTVPPCSEEVTWIIMRYPLTISPDQMEDFRSLRMHPKGDPPKPDEDGMLADNFRSTQPLNDRTVRASFL